MQLEDLELHESLTGRRLAVVGAVEVDDLVVGHATLIGRIEASRRRSWSRTSRSEPLSKAGFSARLSGRAGGLPQASRRHLVGHILFH